MHRSYPQDTRCRPPAGSRAQNAPASDGIRISASIHPADRLRLAQAAALAEQAECDAIHIDIMDGDFASPIASGPHTIESIRAVTGLPLDIHLQVALPEHLVDVILEAGCEILTLHIETTHHPCRLGKQIRAAGTQFGIALNLATPLCCVEELLTDVDLVILMATDPGISGYHPNVVDRIYRTRCLLDDAGRADVRIGVDGGVSPDTAEALYDAGATWLVAGSSLWREGPATAVRAIRTATAGA